MKGKSKYGNVKTKGYASRKEFHRARALILEQRAGLITDLEEQPEYELIPKQVGERAVKYIGDFRYKRNGNLIVEDVKSVVTKKDRVYVLKRKMMLWIHNIRITET